MSRVFGIFRNPLLVVGVIVTTLWLAWIHHTTATTNLVMPLGNILQNGGVDSVDGSGKPSGWKVIPAGSMDYTFATGQGDRSPNSAQLSVSRYAGGSIALTTPEVALKPGTTYLFKGRLRSSTPVMVTARLKHNDGSISTRALRIYPADTAWNTAADAFVAPADARNITYGYSLGGNGTLNVDNNFMLASITDVYIQPPDNPTANLIPNPTFDMPADAQAPMSWSSYTAGKNDASFAVRTDPNGHYLHTAVTNYHDGEAKWQYAPTAVSPGQYYAVTLTYRGSSAADLVTEYVLDDGSRQFKTIASLPAIDTWTTMQQHFEVPTHAVNVFVVPVLHHGGTMDLRTIAMRNETTSGSPEWKRPLVSITFDDGWESAYTDGARLLDTYGYRGTFYLNPGALDTPHFMTSKQVDDLMTQGHELAAHGEQHLDLTTLDAPTLAYQVTQPKTYFNKLVGKRPINFAAPYGALDPQVEYYAQSSYNSVRGTDDGINTKQNLNPNNLLVLYVTKDTTGGHISAALADAEARHGWLILVYHRVESQGSKAGNTVIDPDSFDQQLHTIQQSNIPVVTVSAALSEVRSQSL